MQQLRERIVEHRHELALAFEAADVNSTGKVIKNEWVNGTTLLKYIHKWQVSEISIVFICSVMNMVFKLPLNWAVLQPYLATADDDGNINYTEFLTRYQITVDE